ncbi:hypothetical protein EI94DRAFT_662992 [Lactarius quietus]|nr:hypothetical protein EI94DRAFT_662992 [Lactarius quietus]
MAKTQKRRQRRAKKKALDNQSVTVMATPGDSRTGSPPPPAVPVEPSTSEVLFDYPGADVVIRSHESQVFRVLKLYVVKSSTVLGGLIQAACDASGADTSARAQIQLPVVQLSERSAILSSLLTFIFPVTIILPSTLEETMELLSAAQKYEMSSTITHIRGSLSRKIHLHQSRERFHCLLTRAEVRTSEEAIQAARVTLKFVLTIEISKTSLPVIMPGDYLHELGNIIKESKAELWQTPFFWYRCRGSIEGFQLFSTYPWYLSPVLDRVIHLVYDRKSFSI